MSSINDKGFVIRVNPLNESDKIIIIFSQKYGRINAIAKGINKIRSKRAGSLDLFNKIDFRIHQGKGDFDLLTEVKLISDNRHLKQDLPVINLNYYVLELIDKMIPGHEINSRIFQLLDDFYALQNKSDVLLALELITIFQIKILDILGYTPMLDNCIVCADPILPNEVRFPASQGEVGYICKKHANLDSDSNSTPDVILKIQKFTLAHSTLAASRLSVNIQQMKGLFTIQHQWLQSIIEKKLYTSGIINTIFLTLS